MPTGLIIAAHGSDLEPDVNEHVRQLTARIADRRLFDEVTCAFHRGTPGFTDALDGMTADAIVVTPLMTSQGYYADRVLPEALARARRFSYVEVHRTGVVGCHKGVVDLVRRRCQDLLDRYALSATDTTLVLVGHGTPKHPESRTSTLECAASLRSSGVAGAILPAFLDDTPAVESVAQQLGSGDVMVIPFLIGQGKHASVDVARRLGMDVPARTEVPVLRQVGCRRLVLDLPIGCHAEIMNIVVELACDALARLRKAPA